jgi:putative hydroxymethylpyrimidine transport system substrate-binding protein
MERIRLGLEWFTNPDHVPFFVAREQGWLAEAGIELELVEPKEHMDAVTEIREGRMDVAVTEPIHLVEDAAKGQSVVGFARFLHTNGGVMYLKGRGIERPADMAEKRLQYPGAPGPGGPAIVATMVEADGGHCDPAAIIPVNTGFHHTDALADDKADLATLVFYNFELIEARHRGLDAGFFALKDWGVPDFCQLILITSAEAFEEKRELLARFCRVVQRGIDFIKQRPEEARAIYAKATGQASSEGLGRAIFEATVPCFTYDFAMSSDYYDALERWMLVTGQIASPPERGYWSNTLALG